MEMKTINDFLKTYIPEEYNGFSADKFLDGKKLKIENVKKERVQGYQAIKVDVRIIEDINGENDNKVFTIRLDRTESVSKEDFKSYLDLARNHLGHLITVNPHTDLKQAYFYQQRMLTLIVTHFEVLKDSEKHNIIAPSMKDRPLRNLDVYRVFDIEGFFDENELFIRGTYFEKNNILFNVQIENEALIKFAVPIENADILPSSLLTLNDEVDNLIEDYQFSNASSHRYGTRWTLYFDNIVFKKGTLLRDEFKLEYSSSYNIDGSENDIEKNSDEKQLNQEYNDAFDQMQSFQGRRRI
ncbi:TPA: hypothetical protein ACN1V3_001365 [Staphylococcus aureus]